MILLLRHSSIAIVVFSLALVISSIIPYQAFGDGFTQEILPAASVGNRKVSLFIKINPPIITSASNQDRYILFRWFDANSNQTILHTTFLVAVTKQNQLLMQAIFHTHTGILKLKVIPSDEQKKWSVNATTQPFLDSIMYVADSNKPVGLTAPILGEGGLYHIFMVLITIDSDQNLFTPENAPKFDSYLSVGDVSNHTITYQNNSYNTTLVSYYDKITSYNFDPSKMQVSWTMPFDWNTTRFQNMPIFVHEELRIPKSFREFTSTPTFTASVNGNPITGRMIITDPYSMNNTTIMHLLINKNDLETLSRSTPLRANTMNFTLSPSPANVMTSSSILTDFGGWEVRLQWNPNNILADSQYALKLNFLDAFTEQKVTGDVNYDLKILDKDGTTIFSKTGLTARNGNDTQSINTPSNGIYSIEVSIKSIVNNGIPDTSRTGLARGNLVIPSTISDQVSVPEFPLSLIILGIAIFSMIMISKAKSIRL